MNKYDEVVEFPHVGQVPCSNKTQYSSLFDYRTLNVLCLYPVYTIQPVVQPSYNQLYRVDGVLRTSVSKTFIKRHRHLSENETEALG